MDYNLGNNKTCLIGNWSEELSLQDYAGHYRMPPDGAKGTSTYKRCIEHSLRYQTSELATTNRKDFNNPKASQQNLSYVPNAMLGAREQLMMRKMHAQALNKPAVEEAPREWDTIAQESWKWPEVDQHYRATLGQKKMRSLDNGPIPGRDRTFVLEHRIVKPHLCLETEGGKSQEYALLEQDIPITLYSANPSAHSISAPSGTNPFGKDSGFSMPISQYDRAPMKDL
jgi:hypothetical protein